MANSLRDQLLKSGIAQQFREEKRREPSAESRRKHQDNRHHGGQGKGSQGKAAKPARDDGGIDLAKAYALRARSESQERRDAEREAAEQARLRKERKRKLQQALEGKALNRPDAELMRHFEYAGKIRRVHVDAGQLAALNAGALGVIQHGGRYLLVDRALAEQIAAFAENNVALLVNPDAAADDDGVPPDLVW